MDTNNKKPAATKSLNVKLRRVRSSVRTDVNTGAAAAVSRTQSGCRFFSSIVMTSYETAS